MIEGRTLTKQLEIESRQHELFNIDLGEGISRGGAAFTLVLLVVWMVPLLILFGWPAPALVSVYFGIPIFVGVVGYQRDPKNPRRRRFTQWVLRLRFLAGGGDPIIAGGRRAASRPERSTLRARLGFEDDASSTTQEPIRMRVRPRLIGHERLVTMLKENKR